MAATVTERSLDDASQRIKELLAARKAAQEAAQKPGQDGV